MVPAARKSEGDHEELISRIPEILTWMNMEKGSKSGIRWAIGILLSVIFTVIFGLVINLKSDLIARQDKYENGIDRQLDRISKQVMDIQGGVQTMTTNVGVMKNILEQFQRNQEKDEAVIANIQQELREHRSYDSRVQQKIQ